MRKILFLFLFLFFISGAYSTSVSPSSLVFKLPSGETSCKTIRIDSESSTVSVVDNWAENKDVEWKTANFGTLAEEHSIQIEYDDLLENEENSVEVCLSANVDGEYHGVILLREEEEGNAIMQIGVWVKLFISDEFKKNEEGSNEPEVIVLEGNKGGGGGSGGGGGGSNINQESENNQEVEDDLEKGSSQVDKKDELISEDNNNESTDDGKKSLITGAIIGGSGAKLTFTVLIIFFVIAGIVYFQLSKKATK
jgi:hypothetical protein